MITAFIDWKIEPLKIERMQAQLEKLQHIAYLIKQAQSEYEGHIKWSRSEAATWFPELRSKALWQAEGRRAAHERLRKYFNTLANEIQL